MDGKKKYLLIKMQIDMMKANASDLASAGNQDTNAYNSLMLCIEILEKECKSILSKLLTHAKNNNDINTIVFVYNKGYGMSLKEVADKLHFSYVYIKKISALNNK